jgi:hypothetical protein
VRRGVYAVGRPELTTEGQWMAAVLAVGPLACLPLPETQIQIGGRTDFHWPALGLVVETDGWRYHRTPAQQARDNRRMQAHAAAGRTAVRFSHYEVRYEAARLESILAGLISPAAPRSGRSRRGGARAA